jgi:MFS family permease
LTAAFEQTFASFRIRNFRLYFFGQGLSLCGTWAQTIGLSWLVLKLTHSGTQLGLVLAAQFLPMLILGVWGGVITDRFNKRHLLYCTQTIQGVLALTLGLLVVTHHIELWMVYVLATSLGLTQVVDNPTRQTFIFELAGNKNLKNAVSLNSTMVNVARIVGPSIAGVLIATVGIGACFLINAASFVAVLLALIAMRASELHSLPPVPREKGQIKAGLRYVWSVPVLKATLIMMFIIGTFAYEFPVIMPLFATVSLHGNATTYSAMTVAMGIGAVSGGLYTAGRGATKSGTLSRAAFFFGCSILLLALMPNLFTTCIVMVLIGGLSILFISLGNSTLQLTSEPEMRGRVMALWSIAFLGTTPIGGPIIGTIADHSNPRIGLAVGGLSALIAACFGVVIGRRHIAQSTLSSDS